MPGHFDPTFEIALEIGEEIWEDVLASKPPSPLKTEPEDGWELNTPQSTDFAILHQVAKPETNTGKSMISSRFCHICGRNTDKIRTARCGRVKAGLCRKVVCETCCEKMGISGEAPLGLEPDPSWSCPHCRRACIPTAQCITYGRTNFKRHINLLRRRRQNSRK